MSASAPDADVFISAAEADEGFPQLLQQVREGVRYVVTSDGRPVARLTPYDDVSQNARRAARATLLARLDAQEATDIGRWTREDLYDRHD